MTRGRAALAICAMLVTTGCAAAGPAQERLDDTVVIAWREPKHLNPVLSYNVYAGNLEQIFTGLLRWDKNLGQVPEIAAELPTVGPGGRTVTVRLRPDVTFHDGVPLTAEDVVFTYNSVLNPAVASGFRSVLDSVRSVEAPDRHTVRFSLNRVDPAFFDKLHLGIVPKHLLEGQDVNTAAFNDNPVGAGPYRLREWRKGERLVLEANPDYVGGPPKIRRLVFLFVPDENAKAVVMENGTADVAWVTPRLSTRLREKKGMRVVELRTADARMLTLPNQNPVLRDPGVRRALSFAVDRQQMVDGVLVGAGEPANEAVIPGHWAASPVDDASYYPDRARAMLDDAGWRDGDGDGVRERDGTPMSFTLTYYSEDSVYKDLALAVRQDLAEVGVEAKLEGLGWDAISERLDRDPCVYSLGDPYDPDLWAYELFHSSFAADTDAYSDPAEMVNPEVDAALDAARTTGDQAQRAEHYRELQRALSADGSYLYLVRLGHTVAISDRVAGVDPRVEGHGTGPGVLWNLKDWQLMGGRP